MKNAASINFSEVTNGPENSSLDALITKFKYDDENPLEKQLSSILTKLNKKSAESIEKEEEALKTQNLSFEELKKRKRELGKMRDQMVFQQAKFKRNKKIKSKEYHRHLKKSLKNQIKKLNVDEEVLEMSEIRRKKNEVNSSKYLKGLLKLKKKSGVNSMNSQKKKVMLEQLQREEELNRRVRNMFDVNSESEDEKTEDVDEVLEKPKGVMGMAFMQKKDEDTAKEVDFKSNELHFGRGKFGDRKNKAETSEDLLQVEKNPWVEKAVKHVGDENDDKVVVDVKKAMNFKINNLEFKLDEPEANTNQSNSRKELRANYHVDSTPFLVEKAEENGEKKKKKLTKEERKRELMRRAFGNAGVPEFESEEEDEALKQEEKGTEKLDGWGDWTGIDYPKRKKRRKKKTQDKNQVNKRVRIKENRSAQKKFGVTKLPYPFKTVEEYERSIMLPIGQEWNTAETFDKLTKPEYQVRAGDIIQPLQKSKKEIESSDSEDE
eukprot:augustus_masked-scaffold_2-processed-gene-23.8-mRNA-1 protein AED:0.88 eAED:0.88 QI:0/-1/0/1/-1/1/1/0/491